MGPLKPCFFQWANEFTPSSQIFFFSSRICYYFCIVPITLFVAVIIFYLTQFYLSNCTEDLFGLGHSSISPVPAQCLGRVAMSRQEGKGKLSGMACVEEPCSWLPKVFNNCEVSLCYSPITASRRLHPGCLLLAWIPHPNYDYLRARIMLNESMNF